MNKEHMRKQSKEKQMASVIPYMRDFPQEILERLLPTIIDRINTYGELAAIADHEFGFFVRAPQTAKDKILYKDDEAPVAIKHLTAVKELLATLDCTSPETIKAGLMPYAEQEGKGNVLWPLRMALSGQEKSVDPFTIIYVLGKDEARVRIDAACHALSS
jgi:glutamyl/glutaminyl-tRNA synthetase